MGEEYENGDAPNITVGNGVLDVPLRIIRTKYPSAEIFRRNVEDAVPYEDIGFVIIFNILRL